MRDLNLDMMSTCLGASDQGALPIWGCGDTPFLTQRPYNKEVLQKPGTRGGGQALSTLRAWPRPEAAVHSHGAAATRMPPALACSLRGSAATVYLTCHAVLGASVATITICPFQGCLSVATPSPLLSAPRAQVRILGDGWGCESGESGE